MSGAATGSGQAGTGEAGTGAGKLSAANSAVAQVPARAEPSFFTEDTPSIPAASSVPDRTGDPLDMVRELDAFDAPEPENLASGDEALGGLDIAEEDAGILVLTAPRREFGHFSDSLRKSAALVRQGGQVELHIARGQRRAAPVRALAETLRALGMHDVVEQAQESDAARIAYFYQMAAAADPVEELDEDELQEMEARALELFRVCVVNGATDLHVQIGLRQCKLRIRVDGDLRPLAAPLFSADEGRRLLRAIFAMADNSEPTYRPTESQDARIGAEERADLPKGLDSIRIKFIPLAQSGRYASIRFQKIPARMKTTGIEDDVDSLGYDEAQVAAIKRMRVHVSGCIVVSGPTGSGKSRTLQCLIAARMRELGDRKAAFTVEDPVEYPILGAAQRPILTGATAAERRQAFQIAINDLLRLDPDIVMIGEIRDSESGKLCFTMAQTGHLVCTTLHANNALAAVSRLLDLGVERFNLQDPTLLVGLVSQRLIPMLCPNCARSLDDILEKEWDDGAARDEHVQLANELAAFGTDIKGVQVRGPGCDHREGQRRCHEGYFGRSVVAEVVEPDSILLELIASGNRRIATRYWLEHRGGRSILEVAMERVQAGLVDPRDVRENIGPIERPEARLDIARKSLSRDYYEKLLEEIALKSGTANARNGAG